MMKKKNSQPFMPSRRAILQGLGSALIALPLLEFTHGKAFAAGTGGGARRFVTIFSHGGTLYNMGGGKYIGAGTKESNRDGWSPPQAPGALSSLGPIHQPLLPHMDNLLLVRGIDNKVSMDQVKYKGGHHANNRTQLTCAKLTLNSDAANSAREPLGPSIDQVIAERLAAKYGGRNTPIHLLIKGHNYGSPFYRAAQQKQQGEENPKTVFASLFAGVTPDGEPNPEIVRAWERQKSVLDGTIKSFPSLKSKLGSKDKEIVEAHLQHLRELEQRLTAEPSVQCVLPDEPANTTNPEVTGPLHVDLILAALRCGLTNVANLEISDILTPWAPSGLQVESAFNIGHALGHMARDVGLDNALHNKWALEMTENRQWRMGLLKRLLDGLTDPTFNEGGASMLDNSLVYYTSEFARGVSHTAFDIPTLIAGSAGGYFTTGRYINYNTASASSLDYTTQATTNNLYISFLNAIGEADTSFGAMEYTYKAGALTELQ